MNKVILLAVVGVFFTAFVSQKAEAAPYPARVIGTCSVCHQGVYAYYQPVSYHGIIQYTWVPAYHTQCARQNTQRYVTKYHRGTPYQYAVPSYPVPSVRVPYRHSYGGSCNSHSGYLRPGFSITIRR